MSKTLQSILALERERQVITNLCEKFGYLSPHFIASEVLEEEKGSPPVFCLMVERDRSVKRIAATTTPLQTMLEDKLDIKVEIIQKDTLKELYSDTILNNSISLLDDEDAFRNYYQKIKKNNFDEVRYESLIRTPKFADDLKRAKAILQKGKPLTSVGAFFPQSAEENVKSQITLQPAGFQETSAIGHLPFAQEIEDLLAPPNNEYAKQTLLSLPIEELKNILEIFHKKRTRGEDSSLLNLSKKQKLY